MAAALYEILLSTVYEDQECINRWNYYCPAGVGGIQGAFGLWNAFGGLADAVTHLFPAEKVMGVLQEQLSSLVTFAQMQVKNVYDPTDFYDAAYPSSVVGLVATQALSPVLAYGFQTNRVTLAIRRGSKRFPGVCVSDVTAGGGISSTRYASLTLLAALMSETISYVDTPGTVSFQPCVAQKHMYTIPPAKPAYKYYDSLTEQYPHLAIGVAWAAMPLLRTQVSRQYGRGS